MYIVIAGGGKVGYYLAKTLLSYKHRVAVIEKQSVLCEKIANELNVPVFNGDATTTDILTQTDVSKADIFIAVTGRDEENLIACQLAKRNYGVKRTIARVNNPKNIDVFELLGVDTAVSSTSIIADLIEQEVDYAGIKTLTTLKNGKVVLSEIVIKEDSSIANKKLADIKTPDDVLFVSVIRDEEVIIPNGFTVIRPGDYIVCASTKKSQHVLLEYI